MSIKFIDEYTFDIYVKNIMLKNIDFDNKSDLEKYLKNMFIVLNDKYNIHIEGFYEICVYIDKHYGAIFHLEKENYDYYDYYKNQVDMRITKNNKDFLYVVEDIPKCLLNKVNVLIKNNKIYLKIKKCLSNYEMMLLSENSEIIYEY